jgi:hypothetical protein
MSDLTLDINDLDIPKDVAEKKKRNRIFERIKLRYDNEAGIHDTSHLVRSHTQFESHTQFTEHTNYGGK